MVYVENGIQDSTKKDITYKAKKKHRGAPLQMHISNERNQDENVMCCSLAVLGYSNKDKTKGTVIQAVITQGQGKDRVKGGTMDR